MHWPPKSFDVRLSLLFALALVLTLFVGSLVFAGVFRVLHLSIGTKSHLSEYAYLLSALAEAPVLVLLLTVLPRLARRSLGELGFMRVRLRDIAYAIVGAFAMIVAASLVGAIEQSLFHLKVHENVITIFSKSEPRAWLIGLALLAAVYAPLVEEFVFRGFVFNAVLRYLPLWGAALLSAVIFAAAHNEDPTSFLPLVMAGVVLAYVYYLTGSLVASIITHGTFNFIELSLYLMYRHA